MPDLTRTHVACPESVSRKRAKTLLHSKEKNKQSGSVCGPKRDLSECHTWSRAAIQCDSHVSPQDSDDDATPKLMRPKVGGEPKRRGTRRYEEYDGRSIWAPGRSYWQNYYTTAK